MNSVRLARIQNIINEPRFEKQLSKSLGAFCIITYISRAKIFNKFVSFYEPDQKREELNAYLQSIF
jgi:hypothetical protein